MGLTRELYDSYIKNDFKIILSTGYSSQNRETEEEKRYKAAKKPCEKDWNKKPTKSYEECSEWVNAGGWISAVLPLGTMAVDVDSSAMVTKPDGKSKKVSDELGLQRKIDQLEHLLEKTKHGLHISNNGRHLLFKMSVDYKSSSSVYTKAGINVTYRCGGMSNIIVAPSNGRRWTRFVDVADLDELPTCLQPLNTDDPDDVRRALATQARYCYQNGVLHGNEDIDMALMGTIVRNLGYTYDQVKQLFEAIYNAEYNESATKANYERAKNEAEVVQAGTWFKTLSEKKLYDLIALTNMMGKGKTGLALAEDCAKDMKVKLYNHVDQYAERNKIVYIQNDFWKYGDGFYKVISDKALRHDFTVHLTNKSYAPRTVNDMVQKVKDQKYIEPRDIYGEGLLADNTVIDFRTLKTRPLTDKDIFFYKLPVKFDPNTKCERWEQFLVEIFPDNPEYITFIQKFVGYIYLPECIYDKCLIFKGEGANGKSVFMRVLEKIVGMENISHVSLSQMRRENLLIGIRNKLLNLSPEIASKEIVSDDIFKSLISGEPQTVHELYNKDPLTFRPFAKYIFATNNPLMSFDKSFGYERRIVFVPFVRNFEKDGTKDERLRDKLFQEADGIFAWAMRGLKELLESGHLEPPESLKDNTKQEHSRTNSIEEFASCYLTWNTGLDAEQGIAFDSIFNEYKKFCDMNKYQSMNQFNFSRNLRRVFQTDMEQLIKRRGTKNLITKVKLREVPYNMVTRQYEPELDGGELAGKSVTECSYEEYLQFERMKV